MSERATLLIAEDQKIMADALTTSLNRWYDVVATVNTLTDIAPALESTNPAVAVLDLSFGRVSLLPLLAGFVARYPETKFVILTVHAEPIFAEAALRAGAAAFVVKHSAPEALREAIDGALAKGGINETVEAVPPARTQQVSQWPDPVTLTERQEEALALMHAGHTREEIARRMAVTIRTVDYHLDGVRARVGLSTRAQLVRWANTYFGGRDSTGNE